MALVADSAVPAGAVERAVELWSRCANFAAGFPRLLTGPAAGDRQVRVSYVVDRPGEGKCGAFRGNQITLYRTARRADGKVSGCGALAQNLAHEIGHVFGLPDAEPAAACRLHIMSPLSVQNRLVRTVQADECLAVGQLWLTPAELAEAAAAGGAEVLAYAVAGAR